MVVVEEVGVGEAGVLARGGGAAHGRALRLLQGLVPADVGEAAVAQAVAPLGAVHGEVGAAAEHVPRAEVAQDGGAHLRGAAVALLGGVHHAVDVAGAGRGPAGRRVGPFPVPVRRNTGSDAEEEQHLQTIRTKLFLFGSFYPSDSLMLHISLEFFYQSGRPPNTFTKFTQKEPTVIRKNCEETIKMFVLIVL